MSESQFPLTDRIKALLRQGKRDEARRLREELTDEQFEKAKQGEIISLSDLIAAAESIHIDGLDD